MSASFAHPELLPLMLAALLTVALCGVAVAQRRRAVAAFAGRGAALASASPRRQMVKLVFVAIACLAGVIALVGPQIGEAPRRAPIATVDTVIALDVSQSMAVRDVEPDRLHAAQAAIEEIGQDLVGGRVGLVLFAGSAVLRYPLTADTKIVGPALDTSGHGFRITPGSSIRSALTGAAALFPTSAADAQRPKAIVIVSDGEDPAPDLPALDPLLNRNVHIFTLGIGTANGGSIPVYDVKGQLIQMLVDRNGAQITSRLDEPRLQALAQQGRGRYVHYEGPASARTVVDAIRAIANPTAPETTGDVSPEDRYQLLLLVAIAALIADWLLDERRSMPRPSLPRLRGSRRRILGLVGASVFTLVACGSSDPLAEDLDNANRMFVHDPQGALARYRDLQVRRPSAPEISVDLGNTLSVLGENDRALVEYGRALGNATGSTRAIAFYDRGNALFRLGRVLDARASYVEALRLDPNDREAKFNIEVIDKILELLKPQLPQPSGQPGQASAPPGQQQPSASAAVPTGPVGSGAPTGPSPTGATGPTGATPPPTVQNALTDFRRDLTVEEAFRLLDALRNEQRGLPALLEGTGVRRGGNVDVPY